MRHIKDFWEIFNSLNEEYEKTPDDDKDKLIFLCNVISDLCEEQFGIDCFSAEVWREIAQSYKEKQ